LLTEDDTFRPTRRTLLSEADIVKSSILFWGKI